MTNKSDQKVTVIGAQKLSSVTLGSADRQLIHEKNRDFWNEKGSEFLEEIALPMYGPFISEENHQLFGDLSGKKVLEIGCGSGHSLQYMGEHQANELWGIDISENQLDKAKDNLSAQGLSAKLIRSPMEEDGGLPRDYFDFVYSIYALGWAVDLEKTFCRIASYLKEDGIFIFSWSHPIHKCVTEKNGNLIFEKSYFDDSWYSVSISDSSLTLSDRKLSTYVNALVKAGFMIEEMLEESDIPPSDDSDFARKASQVPVTFVIKAKKI